jgi:hypothetical protein
LSSVGNPERPRVFYRVRPAETAAVVLVLRGELWLLAGRNLVVVRYRPLNFGDAKHLGRSISIVDDCSQAVTCPQRR